MRVSLISSVTAWCVTSSLAEPIITAFSSSLDLSVSFDPIKAAYWTGLPHHRRTPFCISPDGSKAFLAYLDSTYTAIQIQQLNPTTFTAVGSAISVAGYEATGLVCHNDGFALMATISASSTTVSLTGYATNEAPIVSIIRYTDGVMSWSTAVNGPGINTSTGETASPDANGDLTYSETAGLYGAYFVVTAYNGDASGHYGDSIQYVNANGTRREISGASSTFGCSHNTGIAIEEADAAPFATICAEDQGAIWLNTETQYMSGIKIANENTTNGVSGEPMGGMSGSYSNLALFPGTTKYIFAWQSRGSLLMEQNTWLGGDYTETTEPRWLNHNVAIASMSTKNKLVGDEASSTIGETGDSQVNWITESTDVDHQNVRVGALTSDLALVSWETLTSPSCEPVPLSCSGTYAGTSYQLVDSAGNKVGTPVVSTTTFVSGDFATINGQICWPYVDMTWDLSTAKASGTPVSKMSFACASSGNITASVESSTISSSTPGATSSPYFKAADTKPDDGVSSRSTASNELSNTLSISSTISASLQSHSAGMNRCVDTCQASYNTCRIGTRNRSGNQASCLASYSECLGFLPTDAAGSLTAPTACATTSSLALPISNVFIPSYFPLHNSTSTLQGLATGTVTVTGVSSRQTTFSTHFDNSKTGSSKYSQASKGTKAIVQNTLQMVSTETSMEGSVPSIESAAFEHEAVTIRMSQSPVQSQGTADRFGNTFADETSAVATKPTSLTSVTHSRGWATVAMPVTSASPALSTAVIKSIESSTNESMAESSGAVMPPGTTFKTLLAWLAIKLQELIG